MNLGGMLSRLKMASSKVLKVLCQVQHAWTGRNTDASMKSSKMVKPRARTMRCTSNSDATFPPRTSRQFLYNRTTIQTAGGGQFMRCKPRQYDSLPRAKVAITMSTVKAQMYVPLGPESNTTTGLDVTHASWLANEQYTISASRVMLAGSENPIYKMRSTQVERTDKTLTTPTIKLKAMYVTYGLDSSYAGRSDKEDVPRPTYHAGEPSAAFVSLVGGNGTQHDEDLDNDCQEGDGLHWRYPRNQCSVEKAHGGVGLTPFGVACVKQETGGDRAQKPGQDEIDHNGMPLGA